MDFEAENAKEWTGDPTKSSESIQNQPVKNDLPFRATQPKPSTPFPKWQRPMATTGPVKYRPGKYTPTKYLPARYSPARYYPARYAAAKTFVPRKPRQTPVQVQGSYIKESNRFVLNQDNAGKDAWRQRRQPDGCYRLPPNMLHIYNSFDKGSRTDGNYTKSSTLKSILEQIGLQTGAFIEAPARTSDRDLRIWGNAEQVRSAKQQIETWVNLNKAPRKDWVKVYTFSEKKKRLLDKKMEDEAFEQSWRRHPKKGEFFGEQGIYMWPKDGFPLTELLGKNLEAFDAIRMKNHCHIILEPEKHWVMVLSARRKNVNTALDRIHATLLEMIARSKPPTKVYMIEPPKPEATRREVEFVPYDNFINGWREEWRGGQNVPIVVPVMTGPPPTEEDKQTWKVLKLDTMRKSNMRCFKRIVGTILHRMLWYRAQIRMRVNFGIISFRSYQMPGDMNHTLQEFFSMIEKPQTVGDVIGEIEEHDGGAHLITRCREAVGILDPVDAVTPTLAEVQPEFSASFELGFVGTSGVVRLDVAFTKNPSGQYELSSSRWLRMEGRNPAQDMASDLKKERVPMSLCTMDLERETAWELEVSCRNMIPESRITPSMRAFVDRVSLQVRADDIPTPSLSMTQNEIRANAYTVNTHYRYLLKGSTYILEITRAQRYERGLRAQMNPTDTTWRATMYNTEWDTYLGQQASLAIGEVGRWDANLSKFFPKEYDNGATSKDGLHHFYEMVHKASRLVERRWG